MEVRLFVSRICDRPKGNLYENLEIETEPLCGTHRHPDGAAASVSSWYCRADRESLWGIPADPILAKSPFLFCKSARRLPREFLQGSGPGRD